MSASESNTKKKEVMSVKEDGPNSEIHPTSRFKCKKLRSVVTEWMGTHGLETFKN